jgi:peptidoglycan hydrolase-like protein with peptidoglycan-binding domain
MGCGLLSCRNSTGGSAAQGGAPPAAADTTTPTAVAPTAPTTVTLPPTTRATTTTAAAKPTTTTPPTTAPGPASGVIGSSGAPVQQVQQRLSDLGYWLGPVDGRFGTTTQQAVFALQKAAGLPRTGVVDAATAAALAAGTKPSPTSTTGHVIEVDLSHQLVLLVTNGHLDGVLNTSTGGGYVYYDHGSKQVAITPKGHFTTSWEVNGTRVSSLGVLWRPKYFVGGIAIHGDSSVPAHPVSHGCVRVSNQAIDWIWATGSDPIGTPVWVY